MMSTLIDSLRNRFRRDPGPMDCHAVAKVLQQYLDGHLDDQRSFRLEAHLEECRRCGLEVQTYERIKASLADRRAPLPADSVARLREFGERLARGDEPGNHSHP